MNINLKELYQLQKELDEDIAKRHDITYKSTFRKRLLAFIVELGEFSNETRSFKFWSLKPPSETNVILEEYVDGLHFILSLGISLKVKKTIYQIKKKKGYNLVDAILLSYKEALKLLDNYCLKQYEITMNSYLNLIAYLDVKSTDVIKAYKSKLAINFKRQIDHY